MDHEIATRSIRTRMKNRVLIVSLMLLTLCVLLAAQSSASQTSSGAPSAALLRVKHLFDVGNLSIVSEESKQLLAENPNDLELRAWVAVAQGAGDDTDALVNEMKKSSPDSPWTLLASAAGAPNTEKPNLCEKAVAKDGQNIDVLMLAARMMTDAAYWTGKADALKKLLDEHKADFERSADGVAAEASALSAVARVTHDSKSQAAKDACDRALKLNPNNVAMLQMKSSELIKNHKLKESYELLKKGANTVPDSYPLHMAYWKSVMALPNGIADEQSKEVENDASAIITKMRPSANIVRLSLSALDDVSSKVATDMGDLILKTYPDSAASDAVAFVRATKDLPMATPEQNTEAKILALEKFVNRPNHYSDSLLKSANENLVYYLSSQDKPNAELLYKAVMAIDGSPEGVIKLADEKSHLKELEGLSTRKLDGQWENFKKSVANQPDAQVKGFLNYFLEQNVEGWQEALGWVYFNEGRLDDAMAKLEAAHKLSPKDPECAIHLGKVFEAKNDNDKAESLFEAALSMPYYGDGDHPAVKALREFYVHKHGSSDGLDAFMNPILEKDRERRRKAILSAQIKDPKPLTEFKLTSLDGKTVDSDSLKGKYVIINFWATWCGPCRKELPDLNKFYEKYKNDPKVVVLTIATDSADTPTKTVETFVKNNKYTFPVVRGPEYASKNNINAIPMTWFVDPNGKREFEKLGYSKDLMEEYTWRLDAMMGSASTSTQTKTSSSGN